ncbi:MAG: GNAT family N-acetyltransferase [Armatimonadetes bacterium]|nr:GNAT family N-acetyltransferase [Armatimonadota bacterium]
MLPQQKAAETLQRLKDGCLLRIRLATAHDVDAIVQEHPLPDGGNVDQTALSTYYRVKCCAYINAPGAGIVTGWVGDHLAGFVFFSSRMEEVKRAIASPKTVLWAARQAFLGKFGLRPSLWLSMVRWYGQHIRGHTQYPEDRTRGAALSSQGPDAWIGTVHTVERFRRLGVAQALLSFAEQELARHGARAIGLWVAADNYAALQLYEKAGYGRVSLVSRIGEDCWLMVKTVS